MYDHLSNYENVTTYEESKIWNKTMKDYKKKRRKLWILK